MPEENYFRKKTKAIGSKFRGNDRDRVHSILLSDADSGVEGRPGYIAKPVELIDVFHNYELYEMDMNLFRTAFSGSERANDVGRRSTICY
jgi:hypothetical protein